MISNERPSPYRNQRSEPPPRLGQPWPPEYQHQPKEPRPHVPEDGIRTAKVEIERKTFVLALKENALGRFLRITEDVKGRRNTIIIPAIGLEEFRQLLDEMMKASAETPPPAGEPEPERLR